MMLKVFSYALFAFSVYSFRPAAAEVPDQAIRIDVRDTKDRCPRQDIVLQGNRAVHIRLYNKGTRIFAFHAPELIELAGLNGITGAVTELGTNAILVSPGQVRIIALRTPDQGRYFYSCTEINNRDPERTGLFIINPPEEERSPELPIGPDGKKRDGSGAVKK